MLKTLLAVTCMGTVLAVAAVLARWLLARGRARDRWEEAADLGKTQPAGRDPAHPGRNWLRHWLYLAGYRQAWAPLGFVAATLGGVFLGGLVVLGMRASGLQGLMEQSVVLVPGGVGETFLPVVWAGPWLLALMLALTPWLIVRRARRQRVSLVEQDLPLALELLSTLSEAGLAFDAALTRILKSRLAGRPLARELQMYQADLLAGRTRVECLRRLSARLDVGSVSVFVSALAQAEQLGMGIARVLRHQADDVRARRRERALAFANALPVKRVIPLVVCFLPGLFVWTLGPAFVQLFKMVDTFIQVRNF